MSIKKMTWVVLSLFVLSCGSEPNEKNTAETEVQPTPTKQESVKANEVVVDPVEVLNKKIDESPKGKEVVPVDRNGAWGKSDRFVFLENCVNSAKTTMGDEKANEYCSCVLEMVEIKYPNAKEATALSVNDMMEMAKTCLGSSN